MTTVLDCFSNVRIINLVERADRRREMERELGRFGVTLGEKIRFFPARRPDPRDTVGWTTPGVYGCFHSHLSVLTEARDKGWPDVVVLEDDLEFDDRFRTDARSLTQQLERHPDWGIAYFAHEAVELPEPPAGSSTQLVRYDGSLITASFFAVNGKLLPRLVAFLELVRSRPPGHPDGGPMHVDGAYLTFRKQNPDVVTLVAMSKIARQGWSASSITPQWFDRLPFVRTAVSVARFVRRVVYGALASR